MHNVMIIINIPHCQVLAYFNAMFLINNLWVMKLFVCVKLLLQDNVLYSHSLEAGPR